MPPRFGTLDLAKFGKSAGTINGYKTEALTLKGVQILSCTWRSTTTRRTG